VVDGAVTHTHLCPGCAEEVAQQADGLALVLAVPSALRNLGKQAPTGEPATEHLWDDGEGFCPVCGTTLSDLKESGLVGCANCYRVFSDYLGRTLSEGAEITEHLGKIPHRGPETDNLQHEIMRLERMLRELVATERFEEAAGVRDRLSELGQRLEGGS
jgi:protein arginine kinase activator